jgi:glycosyltransferase involved in cell wall biosynthesis
MNAYYYFVWFTITLVYCGLLWFIVFILLLQKSKTNSIANIGSTNKFSVIIPFRNEEKNLPVLIEQLNKINYPAHCFEVLLINDHSTDNGYLLVNNLAAHYKVFSLPDHLAGKKASLKWGAQLATNPWLVFLDADCLLAPEHLYSLNEIINKHNPDVVYGTVLLQQEKYLISIFDYIENLLLQGFTAFGFYIHHPFLANGANWAVKKECFINHQYYPTEGPSGDDIFFLNAYKNQLNIQYSTAWSVKTFPNKSISSFLNQKIRWASKWKKYFDKTTFISGLIFLAGQTSVIVWLLVLFFNEKFSTLASIALFIKLVSEICLAYLCSRFFKQPLSLVYLIGFFMVYSFLSMLMVPLSLTNKYNWKGRIYK